MSEDLRAPKGRRVLYVANPDEDSDERRPPYTTPIHQPYYDRGYPRAHQPRPPLTTDINTTPVHPYQSSNPPLSSPSSASSPAAESTPPPSTPGLPVPPVDFPGDGPTIQDPVVPAYGNDRNMTDGPQISHNRKFRNYLTPLFSFSRPSHTTGDSARRPVSPTVVTPDPYPPTSSSSHVSSSTAPNKVIICVTTDSDHYLTVDISGAQNPAFIRECLFNKLNMFEDEERARYSIYRTEIGSFAIGDALTDDRLFELCRDQGDPKGTLKFLVSYSSAAVHERGPQEHSYYLPAINTIPPPVLPAPIKYAPPMRPARRRSRQGSVSSASEQLPPEATKDGYDADLDKPGRETYRTRPQATTFTGTPNPSSSPHTARRPTGPQSLHHLPRPATPPASDNLSGPSNESTGAGEHGQGAPALPPPPPLSPNRATFEDAGITRVAQHIRSGSDAGPTLERPSEHLGNIAGQRLFGQPRPPHRPLKSEPSREGLSQVPNRTRKNEDMLDKSEWVLVQPAEESRSRNGRRPSPPVSHGGQQLAPSPTRPKPKSPYTARIQMPHIPNPPRAAPPVPMAANETRSTAPNRSAAMAVPSSYVVTWKVPEPPKPNRLNKGTKSMDNLRAMAHPPNLQPGRRFPPQLPMSPPTGNGLQNLMPVSSSNPFGAETRQHPRLPVQAGSLDFGPSSQNIYNRYGTGDPYPRPRSALGESISPSGQNYTRKFASPSSSNALDSTSRSPRRMSPSRTFHSTMALKPLSNYDRDDRSPDVQGASEPTRSTPPRSPMSPLSPRHPPRERANIAADSNSWNPSDGPATNLDETKRSSEATLRQEDRRRFVDFVSSEATLLPSRPQPLEQSTRPRSPPPPSSSEVSTSTNHSQDDDSDSGDNSGTWQIPLPRPTLSVTIGGQPPPPEPSSSPRPFADPHDRWAPRPPPEDVYERLEKFFPEHDLDKPIIEASSGGTSPTAVEPATILAPAPAITVSEKKKSIRYVAQEGKKRIDRTSRVDPSSYAASLLRKRSTKLWGSRGEEVITAQVKTIPSTSSTESSSGGRSATFKWVRGELIGKGTYGRVYLALNANTGEMIAVKQVEMPRTASDKNDSRQITVVQALKMESETLKVLDHPHIVQYLGFEETPTNLSIFLEYVPGGSIGSCLLKHGKFDEDVTQSFTGQILDGLEYLHSRGILHRDLKADNILVEMSGICKISDFGISKRTDDSSGGAFTAMQGTVFWMAPEVINTQKKGYNFKIDIWSVGCVVLEMWAGTRPWNGDELVAVMFKLYQSKLPPPIPDGITLSELADDFRRKCFAINPEERPSAAELRKHPYLLLPQGWVFNGFSSRIQDTY